jgi:hypothetical protein
MVPYRKNVLAAMAFINERVKLAEAFRVGVIPNRSKDSIEVEASLKAYHDTLKGFYGCKS